MKTYIGQYKFWPLVKTTLSLYSKFFIKLITIVAIFQLAPSLLSDFAKYIFPEQFIIHFFFNIIFQISTFIVSFVIIGEVSEICFGSSSPLSKIIARISFRELLRYFGTGFLVVIISFMIVIGPTLIGLIIHILLNHDTMTVFWIGAIIGFILAILILIRFIFVSQVVVIEKMYWLEALKRSWAITRTHFRKIFFFIFLCNILVLSIFGIPLLITLMSTGSSNFLSFFGDIIKNIIFMLIRPFSDIFITLFYYSLRIENDDFSKDVIVDSGANKTA